MGIEQELEKDIRDRLKLFHSHMEREVSLSLRETIIDIDMSHINYICELNKLDKSKYCSQYMRGVYAVS